MENGIKTKKTVAIIGANGYSGVELARLLLNHPDVTLSACFVRDPAWKLSNEVPGKAAKKVECLPLDSLEEVVTRGGSYDSLFFATPAEVSIDLIVKLYDQFQKMTPGTYPQTIVDLSGAFRLTADELQHWYPSVKNVPLSPTLLQLLDQAHYGLSPWNNLAVNDVSIANAPKITLVSNPGCYATSILMAVLPLLKSRTNPLKGPLIDPTSIVIDAKSGTSGGGRSATETLMFTEVYGECTPYRVGRHQHLPEIIRYTNEFAQTKIDPFFSTSLLPIKRGITSAVYAKPGIELQGKTDEEIRFALERAFQEAYEGYSLVRFGSLDKPGTPDRILTSFKYVVGYPFTHVGYAVQNGKIYLFSVIDNLLKGAASQAIENWNVWNGLDPDTGLEG